MKLTQMSKRVARTQAVTFTAIGLVTLVLSLLGHGDGNLIMWLLAILVLLLSAWAWFRWARTPDEQLSGQTDGPQT